MHRDAAPGDGFETRIEDGILLLENEQGRLEVGPVDAVVDAVGGETYVVEYDARTASVYDWLDEDSTTVEIDVRETLASYVIPTSDVRTLAEIPLEGTPETTRPACLADILTTIWERTEDSAATSGRPQ